MSWVAQFVRSEVVATTTATVRRHAGEWIDDAVDDSDAIADRRRGREVGGPRWSHHLARLPGLTIGSEAHVERRRGVGGRPVDRVGGRRIVGDDLGHHVEQTGVGQLRSGFGDGVGQLAAEQIDHLLREQGHDLLGEFVGQWLRRERGRTDEEAVLPRHHPLAVLGRTVRARRRGDPSGALDDLDGLAGNGRRGDHRGLGRLDVVVRIVVGDGGGRYLGVIGGHEGVGVIATDGQHRNGGRRDHGNGTDRRPDAFAGATPTDSFADVGAGEFEVADVDGGRDVVELLAHLTRVGLQFVRKRVVAVIHEVPPSGLRVS